MRAFALFAVVLLFGFPALAQTPESADVSEPKRTHFGFRAGLSMANYYGDELAVDYNTTPRYAPSAGFVFSYQFSDDYRSDFYLDVELWYRWRGAERERYLGQAINPGDTAYLQLLTEDLHSIQLPVLARMTLGDDVVKPYFSLGPVLSYNIMGSTTTNQTRYNVIANPQSGLPEVVRQESETETDFEELNAFEAGMQVGAGLMVGLNKERSAHLVLDLRYDLSLTKLFADTDNAAPQRRNNSWVISLGMQF